jgi:hypothetical protein
MLDGLQLRGSFLVLVVFVIFIVSLGGVFGIKISARPSSIMIEDCEVIEVMTDFSGELILEQRWSRIGSRDLRDYSEKDVLSYGNLEVVKDKWSSFKICLNDKGEMFGVLIISDENKKAGVGVWIEVNQSKGEESFITGNAVFDFDYGFGEDLKYGFLGLMASILLICTLVLVYLVSKLVI